MATTIPDIRVTKAEAGNGFLITCSKCPQTRAMRPSRHEADLVASQHQADHASLRPADGVA